MDKILQPILQSPKLPDYVEELKRVLAEEEIKRNEFYNWLDEDKRAEFISGEVIIHSPARSVHIEVLQNLLLAIAPFVQIHHLGKVYTEQALIKLKRSDVMPDLAFWKNQSFTNETKTFPAPDFIIEVLSKSTEKYDRRNKKDEYAFNGVREYWIVDADKKIIEQYILDNEQFRLKEKVSHGTVQCAVLNGLEIELSKIFG
ncbi:MAG: Uma2 family endonuclease [Bacteroidota bacterium]|nr:Uma2 family endonuclease [Bacteroidota bacterium]